MNYFLPTFQWCHARSITLIRFLFALEQSLLPLGRLPTCNIDCTRDYQWLLRNMHVQVRDDDFARKVGRTEATIESKYRLWPGGVIGLAIFYSDSPVGKQFSVVWHFSFRLWYFHFCFTDRLILFVVHATTCTQYLPFLPISGNYQWRGEKNTNLTISITMNFVLFFIFLMIDYSDRL